LALRGPQPAQHSGLEEDLINALGAARETAGLEEKAREADQAIKAALSIVPFRDTTLFLTRTQEALREARKVPPQDRAELSGDLEGLQQELNRARRLQGSRQKAAARDLWQSLRSFQGRWEANLGLNNTQPARESPKEVFDQLRRLLRDAVSGSRPARQELLRRWGASAAEGEGMVLRITQGPSKVYLFDFRWPDGNHTAVSLSFPGRLRGRLVRVVPREENSLLFLYMREVEPDRLFRVVRWDAGSANFKRVGSGREEMLRLIPSIPMPSNGPRINESESYPRDSLSRLTGIPEGLLSELDSGGFLYRDRDGREPAAGSGGASSSADRDPSGRVPGGLAAALALAYRQTDREEYPIGALQDLLGKKKREAQRFPARKGLPVIQRPGQERRLSRGIVVKLVLERRARNWIREHVGGFVLVEGEPKEALGLPAVLLRDWPDPVPEYAGYPLWVKLSGKRLWTRRGFEGLMERVRAVSERLRWEGRVILLDAVKEKYPGEVGGDLARRYLEAVRGMRELGIGHEVLTDHPLAALRTVIAVDSRRLGELFREAEHPTRWKADQIRLDRAYGVPAVARLLGWTKSRLHQRILYRKTKVQSEQFFGRHFISGGEVRRLLREQAGLEEAETKERTERFRMLLRDVVLGLRPTALEVLRSEFGAVSWGIGGIDLRVPRYGDLYLFDVPSANGSLRPVTLSLRGHRLRNKMVRLIPHSGPEGQLFLDIFLTSPVEMVRRVKLQADRPSFVMAGRRRHEVLHRIPAVAIPVDFPWVDVEQDHPGAELGALTMIPEEFLTKLGDRGHLYVTREGQVPGEFIVQLRALYWSFRLQEYPLSALQDALGIASADIHHLVSRAGIRPIKRRGQPARLTREDFLLQVLPRKLQPWVEKRAGGWIRWQDAARQVGVPLYKLAKWSGSPPVYDGAPLWVRWGRQRHLTLPGFKGLLQALVLARKQLRREGRSILLDEVKVRYRRRAMVRIGGLYKEAIRAVQELGVPHEILAHHPLSPVRPMIAVPRNRRVLDRIFREAEYPTRWAADTIREDRWYALPSAAEVLGWPLSTLQGRVKRGKIPSKRIFDWRWISGGTVLRLLEEAKRSGLEEKGMDRREFLAKIGVGTWMAAQPGSLAQWGGAAPGEKVQAGIRFLVSMLGGPDGAWLARFQADPEWVVRAFEQAEEDLMSDLERRGETPAEPVRFEPRWMLSRVSSWIDTLEAAGRRQLENLRAAPAHAKEVQTTRPSGGMKLLERVSVGHGNREDLLSWWDRLSRVVQRIQTERLEKLVSEGKGSEAQQGVRGALEVTRSVREALQAFASRQPVDQEKLLRELLEERIQSLGAFRQTAPEVVQREVRSSFEDRSRRWKESQRQLRQAEELLKRRLHSAEIHVPTGAIFIGIAPPGGMPERTLFVDDWTLLEREVRNGPGIEGLELRRVEAWRHEAVERALEIAREYAQPGRQLTVGIGLGVLSDEQARALWELWSVPLTTADPQLAVSFLYVPLEEALAARSTGRPLLASFSSLFAEWLARPMGVRRVVPEVTLPEKLWKEFEERFRNQAAAEQAV